MTTDCPHDSKKHEICGTVVCPKCYYEVLMNPTSKEVHAFEKNLYAKVIYVWDSSKHAVIPEIVYPNDPRYETGSRISKGVKPPHGN